MPRYLLASHFPIMSMNETRRRNKIRARVVDSKNIAGSVDRMLETISYSIAEDIKFAAALFSLNWLIILWLVPSPSSSVPLDLWFVCRSRRFAILPSHLQCPRDLQLVARIHNLWRPLVLPKSFVLFIGDFKMCRIVWSWCAHRPRTEQTGKHIVSVSCVCVVCAPAIVFVFSDNLIKL